MQIFGGIAAALYHRERTGEGQKVEFNLYHTGVWMVGADIMDALFGLPLRSIDPDKSDNPFYDVYECKDGRWLQLTAADRYAKAADPAGQASGPRSAAPSTGRTWPTTRASPPPTRQQHRDVLTPMLNEVFLTRTYAEWETRLRAENLMYGPILSPERRHRRPAGARQRLLRRGRPARPRQLRTINSPTKFVQDPASIKSPTPGLGEQTEEILASSATAEEIAELREEKVVL